MSPIFGHPPYDSGRWEEDSYEDSSEDIREQPNLTEMAFWYMLVLVGMLLLWLVLFFCLRIIALRQKTRSPQQRRMYMGTRARPSLGQNESPIYVSPSNLPPPPKYECMAPPSYEEVVGVHYPNYPVQPITQPITAAMAQSTSSNATTTNTDTATTAAAPETVITVASEPTRTSVTVTRS